ncbi:MAG: sigma-70 family RNA polymerase sigma factor [Brumimicrobium sp.]|nr:sigma-70 family RNA polymerase sigma factor [Brumimicrobium sp.]
MFFKRKNRSDISERELVVLAKKNIHYFEELYNRNFEIVFRFTFKRLGGNESLSADITQETFIKAMGALSRYEDRGYAFSTWLIRIAQNEINMYFRKNKKVQEIVINHEEIVPLAREIYDNHSFTEENYENLIKMLNDLPPDQADLLELRFFQNMPFKKIADIYDITEANAKMKIYRIIEKMRTLGSEL